MSHGHVHPSCVLGSPLLLPALAEAGKPGAGEDVPAMMLCLPPARGSGAFPTAWTLLQAGSGLFQQCERFLQWVQDISAELPKNSEDTHTLSKPR